MNRKIVIPELEEIALKYEPKYRSWSDDENATLRKYYHRVPIEALEKYFKRSKLSIQSHASAIGLSFRKRSAQ